MTLDVSVSMYVGIAIGAIMLSIYIVGLLFPTKVGDYDETHKIFCWITVVALSNLVLQSNLLADMGNFIRWDGLEFNYERWIVTTISVFFLGLVATCHGWHDFVHGWAAIAGITVGSLFMLFAGLGVTDGARWVWFVYGALSIAFSFYFGFFKANRTVDHTEGGRKNTFRRNMMLLFIALVYVFLAFNVAIFFFSNLMLHTLGDDDLATWLLWVGTCGLCIVGIFGAIFYQPAPHKLVNPEYAQVPTADGTHLSAVDASQATAKTKSS